MAQEKQVETRSITQEEAEACAREQVQFIGTIQPHGFILVVDRQSLQLVQYSDNFLSMLNQSLDYALEEGTEILGTPLSDWLDYDTETALSHLVSGGMTAFEFSPTGRISNQHWECLGILHEQYVTLEFFPTSTEYDSYQLLLSLDRIVQRIKLSRNNDELFQVLTEEFQAHTGYDRVMLYRFLPDWSGEVLAESVSENTQVQFVGLRFPAEDIPEQARKLYSTASLRIMADVDAEPAGLVPAKLPNGEPLDQSRSVLRGMSAMHIAYLKNMGVKASLSIALMNGDKLWGLIACHHYTRKVPPNHMVSEMKASCELFAEIVVNHLHSSLDFHAINKLIAAKKKIEECVSRIKHTGYELDEARNIPEDIYPSIDKDFVGICINKQCYVFSEVNGWKPGNDFIEEIKSRIKRSDTLVYASHSLLDPASPDPLPDSPKMAGIMALGSKRIEGLTVFFGALEVIKNVNWGGKPDEVTIVSDGKGQRHLEPRASFSFWQETVKGQSENWTEQDRELLYHLLECCEDFVWHCKSESVKQMLHNMSYNDALTGLPNRRFLEEYIDSFDDDGEITATFYFIDLDNFKRVNDYLGHAAGDHLLKVVATRIKECVRPDDVVSRLGGDEFVVILRHRGKTKEEIIASSELIAQKMLAAVGQPLMSHDQPMITTPSIGVLVCQPSESSFTDILKRVDIAMYRAKHSGKNMFHFFSEEDLSESNREVKLELELRHCLEKEELDLYFQPQIDNEGRVIGAEGLARWLHKDMGYIPPDTFIPLAEKNNLIMQLGMQVFEKVCQQMVEWQGRFSQGGFQTVSFNVSTLQLLTPGFEQTLIGIAEKYELSLSQFYLEITESLFMQNFEKANDVLRSLRKKGMKVSLDDFGTGYSSLSYLWKLPIDEVKIDKSFVASITNDDNLLAMVESILSLCQKLNIEVIAEGVEDKVHLMILKGLGCKRFQGYHFGRPVPAEQFDFENRPVS